MSQTVVVNGSNYTIPDDQDAAGWGADLTSWIVAITQNVLQRTGGTFTLSADADFGGTYGLKSTYFKSRSSNIAGAGVLRLAVGDAVKWRNNTNSADIALAVDGSNNLTWDGSILGLASYNFNDTSTIDLALSGANVTADVKATSIANSHIATDAAIALSKLAATTASRALVSDASGFVSAAAVTSAELALLSGKIGVGKVLQVIMGTTETTFSTTSSTFQDTGLQASITPSNANSKIRVTAVAVVSLASGVDCFMQLYRGSTALGQINNGFAHVTLAGSFMSVIQYLDSPNTTSSTNYKIGIRNSNGSTTVYYGGDSGQASTQVIILEEVAP